MSKFSLKQFVDYCNSTSTVEQAVAMLCDIAYRPNTKTGLVPDAAKTAMISSWDFANHFANLDDGMRSQIKTLIEKPLNNLAANIKAIDTSVIVNGYSVNVFTRIKNVYEDVLDGDGNRIPNGNGGFERKTTGAKVPDGFNFQFSYVGNALEAEFDMDAVALDEVEL